MLQSSTKAHIGCKVVRFCLWALIFKSNKMKNFLINLAITILAMYSIVAFISFMPNPATWDCGGRGAFAIFSLIITAVATAIQDSCKS